MRHTQRARASDPTESRAAILDRHGFTLAELIVGVMLLTVGLGALAGTSAWTFRESVSARRVERAANLARSRLELLRLGPCGAASGVEVHGDLIERWSVSQNRLGALATVAIAQRDSGRMREQRYHAAFPC